MQADTFITVSEYSREGIVQRFGTDRRSASPWSAKPPTLSSASSMTRAPVPTLSRAGIDWLAGRIVVYLGGFSPHKNLEALVSAFAQRRRAAASTPTRSW